MSSLIPHRYRQSWKEVWMRWAGRGRLGRFANRMAALAAPPHKARTELAELSPNGFISADATLYHDRLELGKHVFIGDRVVLFQRQKDGSMRLGDRVCIHRDCILETGYGGSILVDEDVSIHPRCQINAFVANIEIGRGVMIGPSCAFYSYNHGILPDRLIRDQPLESKGGIIIGEEAWVGVHVTVLSGVRVGRGAVLAAGAVVMRDVPDGAIVGGNPARVLKLRSELKKPTA